MQDFDSCPWLAPVQAAEEIQFLGEKYAQWPMKVLIVGYDKEHETNPVRASHDYLVLV